MTNVTANVTASVTDCQRSSPIVRLPPPDAARPSRSSRFPAARGPDTRILAEAPGKPMRVLLIDDNIRFAATLQASLELHGYAIDVAHTAELGDETAVVEHHDVIVLDLMLPQRSGIDLCRSLRRQKVTAPILILSALASTADKVAGLDAGADDYLTKPFQLDELLARLRSMLRRSQASEGATLRSGDLVMDLYDHQVTVGSARVKLSQKQFALLEYMLRNPRRLLTRSMISESVWDMNHESSSNVIDVYVSSLRRKIDTDPKHRRIETVIGSGYRFLEQPEGSGIPAQGTAT
jgi:DNA-binding response OmpR family regulator